MINTFIIYTFVFLILWLLAFVASNRVVTCQGNIDEIPFFTWEIIVSLALFTFVFGFRYDVGIDYVNYEYYYLFPEGSDADEYLYCWVSKALSAIGAPTEFFFSFWVFLQFFFLLYAFKEHRYLYPYLILVFIFGQYFLLWMNVIRQDLAFCIFLFSIKYIVERKFWMFFLLLFIAFGIHKSAILLIIFYPIFIYNEDYTKKLKIWVQLSLLLMCAFIYASNFNILGDIDTLLDLYLGGTDYERYSKGAIEQTTTDSVVGISFLSNLVIDIIVILYSNKLKEYYSSKYFLIFYNLYFIGALLGLLFGNSFILLRPVRYFRFYKLAIVPYLLYYLYQNKEEYTRFISYCGLLFMYVLQYVAIFFTSPDSKYQYHNILWREI